MRVHRLEFLQPDGRWCGPYCAEWMTEKAFEIRRRLIAAHTEDDPARPWPDPEIFAANPGPERYVCGTTTLTGLGAWFGDGLTELVLEGGSMATYEVPDDAIASNEKGQVVYMQRRGVLIERIGLPTPPSELRRLMATP